jgi:phosphate-selective porin OprO and OprP
MPTENQAFAGKGKRTVKINFRKGRPGQCRWNKSGSAWLLAICILLAGPHQIRAGSDLSILEARLKQLEEQVHQLREDIQSMRRSEPSSSLDAAETPAAEVAIGGGGLSLRAADDSLGIQLRGYFQADSRFHWNDDSRPGNDTFLMRRIRPLLLVTAFRDFDFRFMPDFGGASATLQDAHFNWKISPQFQVLAGKVKSPGGLERLQSAASLAFVERGLPTHLLPNRDIGVQVHGALLQRRLDYAVGVFNGTKDGGNSVVDVDDGKDIAVRLFAHPFRTRDRSPLQGLGIGVAGTSGRHAGVPRGYATTGQQDFFRFRTGVVNDGRLWRISPQGYFYSGPVGILWEWAQSSQELRLNDSAETVRNRAWQIAGSYLLTGENASYGAVHPRTSLGPGGSGWGALELVARIGRLAVDERAFSVLADPEANASQAQGLGLGLNWYLNRSVKFTLDFGRTSFESHLRNQNEKPPEKSLFSRVQFAF